jgi:hypothetical protein
MDYFYFTISIIAIVLLIIILTFFGLMMQKRNKGAPFPPIANPCPDYWKVNENGTCSPTIKSDKDGVKTYFNTGSLSIPLTKSADSAPYATESNTFDPQDVKWASKGKSAVCAQRDFALQNGIQWDGVSSYNGCQ